MHNIIPIVQMGETEAVIRLSVSMFKVSMALGPSTLEGRGGNRLRVSPKRLVWPLLEAKQCLVKGKALVMAYGQGRNERISLGLSFGFKNKQLQAAAPVPVSGAMAFHSLR